MKQFSTAVLPLLLASCSVFGGDSAINLHGGGRTWNDAPASLGDPATYGVEAVLGTGSGWALEGQAFRSEDDDNAPGSGAARDLTATELAVGARRTFLSASPVRPYFGLGVNWIDAELETSGAPTLSDDGFGGYAHVGALAAILSFQVGVDVRGGLTSAELAGERLDYVQATIFLGLTW